MQDINMHVFFLFVLVTIIFLTFYGRYDIHTLTPNAVKIDILYSIHFMPQFIEQEIAPR